MTKIFITRMVPQEAIDMLTPHAEIDIWEDEDTPPREELLRRIADIDGLLLWGVDDIDSAAMDAAPNLKVIANIAVGYNNIDIEAATRRGIRVSNTPGVVTETTADLAFGLLLSIARRITETNNLTLKGGWKMWGPMDMLGQDVHHKTLGIVGMGRIGSAIAKRASGFSMKVVYHDAIRRTDEAELGVEYIDDIPTLLGMSDFITLHVPLMKETRHLIGAKEFSLMKPTAILINASRGGVVDQKALYEALKKKKIWGAAIDVTEEEPISPNDPLLTLDNIIITPHIGTQTWGTGVEMSVLAVENLLAGLKGEPMPTCVNCHLLDKVNKK
ncbi:2-hydroxyacid dehydrogenase [Chloroflexota bacterium]